MQKREYREWVKTVYENVVSKPGQHMNEKLEEITKSFRSSPRDSSIDYHIDHEDAFKMEESFTIHLGAHLLLMVFFIVTYSRGVRDKRNFVKIGQGKNVF